MKIVLCPNPFRDKGLKAAKSSETLLGAAGVHTECCFPFPVDKNNIGEIDPTIKIKEMKPELPAMRVGDTVRVTVRVTEGNRERTQAVEGTIIAKKHGGINETFTVRRISYGVGVEKVFPLYSPVIEKVETVRKGKVRRAKLYYLRDRVGKAAKVKEKL